MQTLLANPVLSRPAQEQPRKPERKPDRDEGNFAEVLGSKNREAAQHTHTTDTSEHEKEPSKPLKATMAEPEATASLIPTLGITPTEARPMLASGPLTEHLHHLAPTESEAFKDLQIHVSKVSAPRLPHPTRVRLDASPEAPTEQASKTKPEFDPAKLEDAPPEKAADLPAPQAATTETETPEPTLEEEMMQQLLLKDPSTTETPVAEVTPTQAISEVIPELPVVVPSSLHLEIQDAVGRWEMDVSRVGNEVFFEFQGDHSLRELVRESAQEISQRLSRHGDVVGAIHWRPIEGSQTTSGQTALEYSEPREQNQNKGQNRQGSRHSQNDQQSSSPEQFSTLLETL